jgi:nucleoside diphosphate kinase
MTVVDWLLDSDPSIRWQTLRDLGDAPAEVVAAERMRVALEGWGARLLALEGEDGLWEGGALFPVRDVRPWPGRPGEGQPWTATAYSLVLLRDLGVDPHDDRVRRAGELVCQNARWEHAGQPFFSGEVEPCINGMVVDLGAWLGQDVDEVVRRLVDEQLEDGGWNCEAENGSVRSSFHTTIRVLEGLLAHEQATDGWAGSRAARRRGEEYLLVRRLLRRRSTGEVVDPAWLQFSFPTRWHYDVVRGLEHFRSTGDRPDSRIDEAIDLVRSKQQLDGTWLLENTHPGAVHFTMDAGDGQPSRWNTLRALRVLRWYDEAQRVGPSDPRRRRAPTREPRGPRP